MFWAYRTEEIKSYESKLSLFLFTKAFDKVNDCNKLSYYTANFVFDKVTVSKNGPIHFSIKLYHAIKGVGLKKLWSRVGGEYYNIIWF